MIEPSSSSTLAFLEQERKFDHEMLTKSEETHREILKNIYDLKRIRGERIEKEKEERSDYQQKFLLKCAEYSKLHNVKIYYKFFKESGIEEFSIMPVSSNFS